MWRRCYVFVRSFVSIGTTWTIAWGQMCLWGFKLRRLPALAYTLLPEHCRWEEIVKIWNFFLLIVPHWHIKMSLSNKSNLINNCLSFSDTAANQTPLVPAVWSHGRRDQRYLHHHPETLHQEEGKYECSAFLCFALTIIHPQWVCFVTIAK